jgi:hypothetical protein
MLTYRMSIHCRLTAMATKGGSKGKGNARAKMPTSVINRRLLFDRDRIKGFISEHIRGLIPIYNVCGVKDARAWDLFYDIIFLDPVTTRHFSQFQLTWPHHRSRSSPFLEWWAAFRSYMGQMFDKTRDQRTIGGGTTPMPSGIKSIAPICRPPAQGRLNAPVRDSLGMLAMISGQRLSHKAAGSTSQATSWPLNH